MNSTNRSQYKKLKIFWFKCFFINTCVFICNKFTFLDGEQGLQFFRLASCGQDCQIKIWVVSFTHISGMYSTSSSLKLFVSDKISTVINLLPKESGYLKVIIKMF